jgi:hypothetical protein
LGAIGAYAVHPLEARIKAIRNLLAGQGIAEQKLTALS